MNPGWRAVKRGSGRRLELLTLVTKRKKHQQSGESAGLLASNFGRRAVIFDELEVIELLRAAVDREGSQAHFARRHGIDRVQVNRLLKGRKMNVTEAVAKALRLRNVFVAE